MTDYVYVNGGAKTMGKASEILFAFSSDTGRLQAFTLWESKEWMRRKCCCVGCAASVFPAWRSPVRYHQDAKKNAKVYATFPTPCPLAAYRDEDQ